MGSATSAETRRLTGKPDHSEPPSRGLRLDELPGDVFALVTRFLLGTDVLRLSFCGQQLRWLASEETIWRHRVLSNGGYHCYGTAQHRYCHATSLFFRGSWPASCRGQVFATTATFDYVPLPPVLFPRHRDISFDVWFALVPSTSPRASGGVIVGAQDIHASQSVSNAPKASECFAFVDQHRQLYCSVVSEKPVVARALQDHRWYHLALTYDHTLRQQCVYLDGSLLHTMEGSTEFPWLQHAQLGAGFGRATRFHDRRQWCGFRGLVDEFRVCYFVWTPAQIKRLALGKPTDAAMAYTQTRDLARGAYALGGCWLDVTCTRPVERYVEITRCWTPRLLATRHMSSAPYHQSSHGTTTKSAPSLWQLLRQCL